MSRHDLIETRSIDYIPLRERHGKVWHLWPIWFTGNAQLATVATGAIGVAAGLNLLWSAVAILAGSALGTFFMAFHSTQGPQLGLPQMIQSRPQFGAMGALLVWFVALVNYVGFNAFNLLLAAQSLHVLASVASGYSIAAFSALATIIACVGYRWIHFAQRGLAGLMLAALGVFTLGALFAVHLPAAFVTAPGFRTTPFLLQFFAAASYQLTWSIYVSDYSRYLPKDVGVRAAFWWTFLGTMLGGGWMMLVGMIAAAAYPKLDLSAAVVASGDAQWHGFGAALLIASLGGLVTITSLNLYGTSLTLLSVADSLRPLRLTRGKRLFTTILAAVASIALALLSTGSFVDRFADLLAVLLYLFTPWTAINLVDFYVVRKGHYSIREILKRNGMYGRWNWRGLSAYGVGFVAMVPFFSTGLYTGPIARLLGGADVAMVVGLPVSALVYWLACRSMDLTADRREAAAADLGLEPSAPAV